MSLPPESLPDHIESTPAACPAMKSCIRRCSPLELDSAASCDQRPGTPSFPAWKVWDVAAIVIFSIVIIIAFTIIALFVARAFPQYHNASFSDLATDARVVIGAQAAAYPIILLFIFVMVRSRSHLCLSAGDSMELAGSDSASFYRFWRHPCPDGRQSGALPSHPEVAAHGFLFS